MRILIIRHADPEYINDSLTRHGRREAAALARYLASDEIDVRPTRLYTSPRGRARATARYAEKLLGLKAEIEPWTTELTAWPRLSGGSADAMAGAKPGEGGLALWDTAGEEPSVRQVSRQVSCDNEFSLVPALVSVRDSFAELQAYSDMFLARHGYAWDGGMPAERPGVYRTVLPNDECIAVFCHGGFGLAWIAVLLGLPLMTVFTSFYLAPSSVTTILMDVRSSDFACPRALCVGGTPHLEKEGVQLMHSKYERPNKYKMVPGAKGRVSGVKSNFY
jgi:broad specificity phosphatase PhoE